MKKTSSVLLIICLSLTAVNTAILAQPLNVTFESLIREMSDRTVLTHWPEHEYKSLQSSSYNRASKTPADVVVQEYGKYFGMNTVVFRGGCLTGPNHSGTQLHGFLSYLMKCAVTGDNYTIFGYKGKQVRDNIHASDLVNMFWHYHQKPRPGEVYNAGGGRHSNCSMMEAIALCEKITGRKMNYKYAEDNRIGDHIWWISDVSKFKNHYPAWNYEFGINEILTQIYTNFSKRL